MNEVMKALHERRSTKQYLSKPVPDEIIEAIVEAGTWAPSAMGAQSAQIVVVKDPEMLKKLAKGNAAVLGQENYDPFHGAPNAVVVLADGETENWLQDGSLVMANMLLAAHSLGIGACWINRAKEYFDLPEGKEVLRQWGLPEKMRGVAICILGYADGPAREAKPRKEDYIVRR